jgi:hypothetical protein
MLPLRISSAQTKDKSAVSENNSGPSTADGPAVNIETLLEGGALKKQKAHQHAALPQVPQLAAGFGFGGFAVGGFQFGGLLPGMNYFAAQEPVPRPPPPPLPAVARYPAPPRRPNKRRR